MDSISTAIMLLDAPKADGGSTEKYRRSCSWRQFISNPTNIPRDDNMIVAWIYVWTWYEATENITAFPGISPSNQLYILLSHFNGTSMMDRLAVLTLKFDTTLSEHWNVSAMSMIVDVHCYFCVRNFLQLKMCHRVWLYDHRLDGRYIDRFDEQPMHTMIFTCVSIHLIDQCNVLNVGSSIFGPNLVGFRFWLFSALLQIAHNCQSSRGWQYISVVLIISQYGRVLQSIVGGGKSIPHEIQSPLVTQGFQAHNVELPSNYRLFRVTTDI